MIRFVALIFILIFPLATIAAAQERSLHFDLADGRVDITTGFDGTRITAFGTYAVTDGDLVILLKGPDQTVTVRQKSRVLGAWMNRSSLEFRRVPSYYDYASTAGAADLRSLGASAPDEQIGVDALGFYPEDDVSADEVATYRDALVRAMQEKGLYPLRAHGVDVLAPGFFKVAFDLPPGVPTGPYTMSALLVRDGEVLDRQSRTLRVGQVGFNARIYLFAQNYSLFYGLMAVVIALASGWSAFTFLRRD